MVTVAMQVRSHRELMKDEGLVTGGKAGLLHVECGSIFFLNKMLPSGKPT